MPRVLYNCSLKKPALAVPGLVLLASGGAWALPIGATTLSGLDFGIRVQGDSPMTVPSGTSENARNASIVVTGDINAAYTIVLPASPVIMSTGAGGAANERISVTGFTSFPVEGLNGQLNASGNQTVFVGATQGALLTNQVAGAYSGVMTVTVSY